MNVSIVKNITHFNMTGYIVLYMSYECAQDRLRYIGDMDILTPPPDPHKTYVTLKSYVGSNLQNDP